MFPGRNAVVWASDDSNETALRPDVRYDRGTSSEECVSEDKSCACCLASRNTELLERAEKLGVEVSLLSRREGRFRRLYLWCGTKSELVDSCDGI